MQKSFNNIDTKNQLIAYLSEFVSENKKEKINEIVKHRTRHITVVLEDIFQTQNASAVLRSCDCFGIQDVHIIENRNKYNVNTDVALGSSKWLDLIKYNKKENNTEDCLLELKRKGYKIIATSPNKNDCLIDKLNIQEKFALVFGTELNGLSDIAFKHADGFIKIPMYGFTESFNISVSVAMCLHYLSEKLRKSEILWQLSDEEVIDIKINCLKNAIKKVELLEKEFYENLKTK